MSALAGLQRDFQQHVLGERRDGFDSRSVVSSAVADGAMRVNVYTYAYRARLVEVLGNDFHGLRAMLGAEAFAQMGHAYVESIRSNHYNVRWYGQHLSRFLSDNLPWSNTPAIAEMANLEWTMGTSFDAPDESFLDAGALETLLPEQWPGLRLRLHPSVQLLALEFNTGAIRRAIDRDESIPPSERLAVPETWIVSRRDTAVRYRLAEVDEVAALKVFDESGSLAQVCAILCDWHAEDAVAMRAASLLKQWIYDQWVAELMV